MWALSSESSPRLDRDEDEFVDSTVCVFRYLLGIKQRLHTGGLTTSSDQPVVRLCPLSPLSFAAPSGLQSGQWARSNSCISVLVLCSTYSMFRNQDYRAALRCGHQVLFNRAAEMLNTEGRDVRFDSPTRK